jgi:hypothetical protein
MSQVNIKFGVALGVQAMSLSVYPVLVLILSSFLFLFLILFFFLVTFFDSINYRLY